MILHVDFETRSAIDLKKTGVDVYARHPSTDVWCMAFAFDEEPVDLWLPGQPLPARVEMHILCGGVLVAHNAAFERTIWRHVMAPRYGWPEPDVEQWRCTMATGYAMALPGNLDDMSAALGSQHRKDMAGHRLMLQMAKPRKPKKGEPKDVLLWWDDEDRRNRLYAYCKKDVEAERETDKHLVRLRASELALWHLDQRINDRGVQVDVELCRKAKDVVAFAEDRLDREMAERTDWHVSACSNLNQIKTWLKENGVQETEALDREAIDELLARSDLPVAVRRPLEIRREAGKASVRKIDALLNGASLDGRARGLLQYHAASTGRWGGRRFQPQNIKRPDMVFDDVLGAIDVILKNPAPKAVRMIEAVYGPVLSVIGDTLRCMVCAAPGKKLVTADFSNIEGRVLAWLAGQSDKLAAFRAFDAKTGPDLYLVAAAAIYGVPIASLNKESPERQIGKVSELACGYQGGVGAFQTMAHTYGVKVPDELAADIVKKWRFANPAIKQYWRDLEDAAFEAVSYPGTVVTCRSVRFKVSGSFLWLQLPSGRALCYPYPRIVSKEMPWEDENGNRLWKDVVSYMGMNSYTRKWETLYAYGGKWAENITQAVARDMMAEAMVRLEGAGYSVVLTVHDEIVSEVAQDFGSLSEFKQIMVQLPAWATGCPVAAGGWEGSRYRK